MRTPEESTEHHIGPRDLTSWSTGAGRALVRLASRVGTWAGGHGALLLTVLVGLGVALTATWGTGDRKSVV